MSVGIDSWVGVTKVWYNGHVLGYVVMILLSTMIMIVTVLTILTISKINASSCAINIAAIKRLILA
jgi:hypothetical protein